MKRIVAPLMLVLAAAPLVVPTVPAAAQQGQSDLSRVNAYIRAVTTMTADFSQTDRNGQTLTGKLTLKQPGKIRFQYQKGVPLLIVGDGKALTLIDYEVRQVQRWPIGNSPLGALIDPSKDLSKFGKVIPTDDPSILSVQARAAGLQLYGWVALDSQNNRTAVRLSNQRYGVPVEDSAFRWTDPRPRGRSAGG